MLVIGLTGGIGSGKTTVTNKFEALGIDVVDADKLSREVVEPGMPALSAIAEHFGTDLLNSSGELERKRLREIIFNDPQEKDWLESLLHPLIADLMTRKIENCASQYCVLVSPLLLETDQRRLVDRILVVDISEQSQLERTLIRDKGNADTIKSIIASQISREARLESADDILNNEQDIELLEQAVHRLHEKYLALARE